MQVTLLKIVVSSVGVGFLWFFLLLTHEKKERKFIKLLLDTKNRITNKKKRSRCQPASLVMQYQLKKECHPEQKACFHEVEDPKGDLPLFSFF
jgi:hypothetical protein